MQPTDQPYRVLLAKNEDENFIFDSWLRSYRASDYAKHIDQKVFFYRERQRLERVLSDSRTLVFTARAADDDDQLFGYAVATFDLEKQVAWLHWVYVKDAFRRMGIGAALLSHILNRPEINQYFNTYLTKTFFYWSQSKNFRYNPYMFDRLDA